MVYRTESGFTQSIYWTRPSGHYRGLDGLDGLAVCEHCPQIDVPVGERGSGESEKTVPEPTTAITQPTLAKAPQEE